MLTNKVSIIWIKENIIACDILLMYMSRRPRIDPCYTLLATHAGRDNIFPKLIKNVCLWDKIERNLLNV